MGFILDNQGGVVIKGGKTEILKRNGHYSKSRGWVRGRGAGGGDGEKGEIVWRGKSARVLALVSSTKIVGD